MSQTRLLFSSSPHVHRGDSVPEVMKLVILALMPATGLSVVVFGWPALLVILITMLACIITEFLFSVIRQRPTPIGDNSAALTGLLLALTLPPTAPWWICVVGGVFAIAIGKQVFGGLGYNVFNPALIARVFLLISFPVELTYWPSPMPLFTAHALSFGQAWDLIFGGGGPALKEAMDAITMATPLGQYRVQTGLGKTVAEALGGAYPGYNPFLAAGGLMGGSLGETSAILLAAGGVWMIHKKLITWHIPLAMILGCLAPAAVFWVWDSGVHYPDPFFHLVTGGLVLGAFFMATDMVTSPITAKGQIIFGVGCGLLTYIIRTWGGYPEGVSFAIVIMNTAVPLIDQYTRPTVYGTSGQTQR